MSAHTGLTVLDCREKKLLKVTKLMSSMDFRMILAVLKDLDNQLTRELKRIRSTCFAIYFDGIVNKYT